MKYDYLFLEEKLSDNILCKWSIIKNNKPNKNYNIISVCFFLLEGKKDNDKYINGIKNVIENFNLFKKYVLRIYFDISVKHIIYDILENTDINISKKIELFEYNIPFFKDNEFYHKGYIGTLIRFLPLFDNIIHKVNKCLVLDIDNILTPIYEKIIYNCDIKKINICYRTRYGYSLKDRILCLFDKIIIDYPIIASFIYKSNIDIPYFLLSNFFESIFYKKNDNLIKKCSIKNYEYGIDEIFINKIFLNYVYNNNICFSPIIFNYYQISTIISNYLIFINNINDLNKYIDFLNNFFKLLNIKIYFKKYNSGKIKNIKYIINNIIRKNYNEITLKINLLFHKKKILNDIIKFISNIINNFNNNYKNVYFPLQDLKNSNKSQLCFDSFIYLLSLKYILYNLIDVRNDKILILIFSKNNIEKYYINCN